MFRDRSVRRDRAEIHERHWRKRKKGSEKKQKEVYRDREHLWRDCTDTA